VFGRRLIIRIRLIRHIRLGRRIAVLRRLNEGKHDRHDRSVPAIGSAIRLTGANTALDPDMTAVSCHDGPAHVETQASAANRMLRIGSLTADFHFLHTGGIEECLSLEDIGFPSETGFE